MIIFILLVFPIYFLVRNEWVFRHRMRIIETKYNEYDSYISYDHMMFKFWVWDIEKLKKLQ